jgi:hypothetical protein
VEWVAPSPSPTSPSPIAASTPLSGSSTADWIAAWAQVGAAIGTVLTLAAALWINRRTRIALDEERTARQQDIARLEAVAADAGIQKVKTTAAALLVQVDESVAARDRREAPFEAPGMLGLVAAGFAAVTTQAILADDDDDSTPEWIARYVARLLLPMAVFGWVGQIIGLLIVALSHAAASETRIANLLAELDSTAHPEIAAVAHEVEAAARKILDIRDKTWSSTAADRLLPEEELRAAENRLRNLLEAGPWLR